MFSVLKATEINYNSEVELYKFYLSLYNFNFTNKMLEFSLSCLRDYVDKVVNPILQNPNKDFTLSSLKSLFYASTKLYRYANLFGVHPLTYLHKVDSFCKYVNYIRLVSLYETLQLHPVLVDEYYSSFAPSGILDFQIYRYKPVYLSQLLAANVAYSSSIKHRQVVDSYINSQLDI